MELALIIKLDYEVAPFRIRFDPPSQCFPTLGIMSTMPKREAVSDFSKESKKAKTVSGTNQKPIPDKARTKAQERRRKARARSRAAGGVVKRPDTGRTDSELKKANKKSSKAHKLGASRASRHGNDSTMPPKHLGLQYLECEYNDAFMKLDAAMQELARRGASLSQTIRGIDDRALESTLRHRFKAARNNFNQICRSLQNSYQRLHQDISLDLLSKITAYDPIMWPPQGVITQQERETKVKMIEAQARAWQYVSKSIASYRHCPPELAGENRHSQYQYAVQKANQAEQLLRKTADLLDELPPKALRVNVPDRSSGFSDESNIDTQDSREEYAGFLQADWNGAHRGERRRDNLTSAIQSREEAKDISNSLGRLRPGRQKENCLYGHSVGLPKLLSGESSRQGHFKWIEHVEFGKGHWGGRIFDDLTFDELCELGTWNPDPVPCPLLTPLARADPPMPFPRYAERDPEERVLITPAHRRADGKGYLDRY